MEEQKVKGREVYQTYFTTYEDNDELHRCNECSRDIKQNLNRGYVNLVNHVTGQHGDEYIAKVKAYIGAAVVGAMDGFVRKPSEKAKNIFGWMEWIIMENLPLSSCENKNFRKRSNLTTMTSKTLKKYMRAMMRRIFRLIKNRAPPTFGIIIDGWSIGSNHFFAIFVTWTNEKADEVEEYLIHFGVIEDVDEDTVFEAIDEDLKKFGFTAADWFDVITLALNQLLENYDQESRIDVHNFSDIIEFICADNCATNAKLCNDSRVPMKGCESHRLNLAVQESLGQEQKKSRAGAVVQPASVMQATLSKLDRCMGALKTLKNSSMLRTQTSLRPERRNKTRWSSLFQMMLKWTKIKDKVAAVEGWPEDVLDTIPDATENHRIAGYLSKLRVFESVSKALQASGDKRLNVFEARELLDSLVKDYGEEFPLTAIRRDAAIVQSRHFENAIYKIQGGLESSMTNQEKNSVKIFLKTTGDEEKREDEPTELSYADSVLRGAALKRRRRASDSKYRSTNHVSPTTNIVERANSQAKLIMTNLRDSLLPETLNMIMILKHNKSLWLAENSVQEILDSDSFGDPEQEPDSEEEEDR